MRRRMYSNLIIICLLSVLLSTLSITFVYYNLFQSRVREDLKVNLELLKGTGFFDDADSTTGIANIKTDNDDFRITWVRSDGKVLYDNDTDAGLLDNHLNREEIAEAFETGVGESIRESETMNMNTHYYAELLDNQTVLRVGSNARNLVSVFSASIPAIFIAILVIIIICILLSQRMTDQMLKPVEKMVDSIDSADIDPVYDELKPFSDKIKKQYNEILKTANIREEFSANVSHELKTPLTAIAGYAELMESDPDTSDRHKHFSREIIKSAGRLRSLIDDTIMLSELDHSGERNLEMMRLDEVVGECVTMMKLNAEKKGIDLEYDSEPATVMGVSELITQMAENLIQNAINYNRDDGWVKVAVSRKDGKCILSVRDNGIGIPQEDQSRVFERFYRVERSRSRATGGTGLGLAIVKHIAEIHEADITLNSCINGGTEISVTFDEAYTR
ncbi:MAG: two-component sensor histidine kinase [Erysipelotrichaceae bacterium]|nr:two-component sensor histidine kinase [Erysipelotrichaceae bacterium]